MQVICCQITILSPYARPPTLKVSENTNKFSIYNIVIYECKWCWWSNHVGNLWKCCEVRFWDHHFGEYAAVGSHSCFVNLVRALMLLVKLLARLLVEAIVWNTWDGQPPLLIIPVNQLSKQTWDVGTRRLVPFIRIPELSVLRAIQYFLQNYTGIKWATNPFFHYKLCIQMSKSLPETLRWASPVQGVWCRYLIHNLKQSDCNLYQNEKHNAVTNFFQVSKSMVSPRD